MGGCRGECSKKAVTSNSFLVVGKHRDRLSSAASYLHRPTYYAHLISGVGEFEGDGLGAGLKESCVDRFAVPHSAGHRCTEHIRVHRVSGNIRPQWVTQREVHTYTVTVTVPSKQKVHREA
jgi:hypothetical protein